MIQSGTKTWFTAAELAELALPGLPRIKRKVNERAADERWALAVDSRGAPLARPRAGRGGGLEYSIRILPAIARAELVRRGISIDGQVHASPDDASGIAASQLWSWYEAQNAKTKAEAERRLDAVQRIERYEAAGLTRSMAVSAVAQEGVAGQSTLWAWLKLVEGIAAHDRLPCLAPRRRGGGCAAPIDPAIWQYFKSDFLRPEQPTLAECYLRASKIAEDRRLAIPCQKTFARRLEREIDPRVIIARRKGSEELRRSMPAQKRSVAGLHAMEIVNIDGHKFDVFVRLDDGRVIRPIMVAIQDVYSRKMLAWRIGEAESAVQTRLAFADLFREYGIPKHCLLDNGRAFASKWITGGAVTRFRFKIKEDEPTGLLTSLGIQIHWATPYRGQSKPIERGFRDLCDSIAKHPAFAGAYTGNKPDAKPENYGDKAVPFAEFVAIATRGIAMHNAKTGRRTETANGQSFDQVFAASYAAAPIGKATPEVMRMALLAAEQINVDRKTGELRFMGNRYWSPSMSGLHGRKVTVRFDPDNLHQALHVYDLAGAYLTSAELLEDAGFLDVASAKKRAKQESDWRKAVRAATEMEDLLTAEQLAAMIPDYEDELELPEPKVIRAVNHRGTAAAVKTARRAAPEPDFMDRFAAGVSRLRVVE